MTVTLDHYTPLYIAAKAIRQCWQSQDKSDTELKYFDIAEGQVFELPSHQITCGEADKALIDRVGNKHKHSSTLEHITYNFTIDGISRACLQELARHRISSFSVKSTRYTLKELKEDNQIFEEFKDLVFSDYQLYIESCGKLEKHVMYIECAKYLVYTGNDLVDISSILALMNLRYTLITGSANDKAKYCLPESYKTSLAWSINARSLQNFLFLRSSPHALWEIRDLAQAVFASLPDEHKYLFEDCIKQD